MASEPIRRGFHHLSKAWYYSSLHESRFTDEIMFGDYPEEGGTGGEMPLRWYDLSDGKITPRLEVYNDAWAVLGTFGDVIAELAKVDDKHITPEEFAAILRRCGFLDLTAIEDERARVGAFRTRDEALKKLTVEELHALKVCGIP